MRRSNEDRTAATRAALRDAARALFVEKGYGDTGTPEIVARARVTRGALYHHFADKADLLRAVLMREAQAVAEAIDGETSTDDTPLDALMDGADAYFAAMREPGRARLLLLEGPAVLGLQEMARIDRETGGQTLLDGLAHARAAGALPDVPLEPLAALLSAAFDKAALAIAQGAAAEPYRIAIRTIIAGLMQPNAASSET